MAFDDFRDLSDDFGESAEAVSGDADFDEGGHGEADFFGLNLGVVADDDAGFFEFVDALCGGWGRETDAATELCEGDAGILLEFVEDSEVDLVEGVWFQLFSLMRRKVRVIEIVALL